MTTDQSANRTRALSDEQLLEMANAGDEQAADELDRRGVQPSMLELGPPPIVDHFT